MSEAHALAQDLKGREKEAAEKRMAEGNAKGGKKPKKGQVASESDATSSAGGAKEKPKPKRNTATAKVAAAVGMSEDMLRKVEAVYAAAKASREHLPRGLHHRRGPRDRRAPAQAGEGGREGAARGGEQQGR